MQDDIEDEPVPATLDNWKQDKIDINFRYNLNNLPSEDESNPLRRLNSLGGLSFTRKKTIIGGSVTSEKI